MMPAGRATTEPAARLTWRQVAAWRLQRQHLDRRAGPEKLREGWGALLKPASFRGQLCFAPGRGQLVRFTRPDRWLGGWSAVEPTAALAGVTRRFLAAHGPATREDLGRWWALAPAP